MKTLYFFLVILVCLACSKDMSVSKNLSGTWNLTSLKRTNPEGLISYPNATGTATFKSYEKAADSSSYSMQVNTNLSGLIDANLQQGTYKLTDKSKFMFISTLDSTNSISSYIKYRILTLNQTDLEIEYSRNSNTFILLFKRS